MVKEAMGKKGKTMKGLDEILKIPGAGEKCRKILIEGEYYIYHIPKWTSAGKLRISIKKVNGCLKVPNTHI